MPLDQQLIINVRPLPTADPRVDELSQTRHQRDAAWRAIRRARQALAFNDVRAAQEILDMEVGQVGGGAS